jgi:hypothetical protein
MGGRGRGKDAQRRAKLALTIAGVAAAAAIAAAALAAVIAYLKPGKVAACPPWVCRDISAPCFDVPKKVGSD